jgi:hypothetical protein
MGSLFMEIYEASGAMEEKEHYEIPAKSMV